MKISNILFLLAFYVINADDVKTTFSVPLKTTPGTALQRNSCSPPFDAVEGLGCFYLGSDLGLFVDTYERAVSLCNAHGGKLAIIDTLDKNTALFEHLIGRSLDDKTLLGAMLNTEGRFEWWDGRLVVDTFDDWDEDQPSGNGRCMGYSAEYEHQWDDFQCVNYFGSDLRVSYLCEAQDPSPTTTENPCTPPFKLVDGGCYYYSSHIDIVVDSYEAAEGVCEGSGGHLAMVDAEDKNDAILESFLSSSVIDDKILLGARLNEEERFEWINGVLVDDTFSDWANGQPSGNGECMGYSEYDDLKWDDFDCNNFAAAELWVGFICEAATTTTTTTTTTEQTTTTTGCPPPFVDMVVGCYYLLDQTDDFWTGQDNCLSQNSHLAYINSSEKQLAIEEYLSSITFETSPWIGAHDLHGNDTFFWLDGSAVDDGFTNYGELSGGEDDGLVLNYNFDWHDSPLDSERASLCEK